MASHETLLVEEEPESRGDLWAIGGGEQKSPIGEILRHIALGKPRKRIVIATFASESFPAEQFDTYRDIFHALGVEEVVHWHPDHGDRDIKRKLLSDPKHTALFITGGDQVRLVDIIVRMGWLPDIRRFHALGGDIAGTSAGGVALFASMTAPSFENEHIPAEFEGLGLIHPSNFFGGSHAGRAGRTSRDFMVLERNGHEHLACLNEDSALHICYVNGHTVCTVQGSGEVFLFEKGLSSPTVLRAGEQFSLSMPQ